MKRRYRFIISISMLCSALSGALLAGCTETRNCTRDDECYGLMLEPGMCLHDGRTGRYCAIFTFACPTMWRWAPDAEDSIRQSCVRAEFLPPDGGSDGAPSSDGGADAGTSP